MKKIISCILVLVMLCGFVTTFAEEIVENCRPSFGFKTHYIEMKIGNTKKLSVIGKTSHMKWSSDDKSIVKVDSKGKITARKPGIATITVTNKYGDWDECEVLVLTPEIHIKSTYYVRKGHTIKIKPSFKNGKEDYKVYVEDHYIASVSSGYKVKGKHYGETTITVRTKSGVEAYADLVVY